MDPAGAWALVLGLTAVGVLAAIPRTWLKAGGGLLVLATAGYMLRDALTLLFG